MLPIQQYTKPLSNSSSRPLRVAAGLLALIFFVQPAVLPAQTGSGSEPSLESGNDIYRAACVSCHGADGRGAARRSVGFDTRLPDFTVCPFATKEPDTDWVSILHEGGPAHGWSRIMPAFGDAQGPFQIEAELWYQPISYRWASNLRSYEAAEPRRFVGYCDAMAPASAVMLTHASASR